MYIPNTKLNVQPTQIKKSGSAKVQYDSTYH